MFKLTNKGKSSRRMKIKTEKREKGKVEKGEKETNREKKY